MRINKYLLLLLIMIGLASVWQATATGKVPGGSLSFRQGDLVFEWDLQQDSAWVMRLPAHTMIWQGGLLPSFWLETDHKKEFVKASLQAVTAPPGQDNPSAGNDLSGVKTLKLELKIGTLGRGYLTVVKEDWGIRFSSLEVDWLGQVPAIIEMYFGASDKAVKRSLVWPTWDRPFMPDWKATGFCVPGAKGGTPQSYFRMWDFGLANIALGSFGPSMGSPYGAAYPRPLLFAGMGSDEGFIAMGAGSIPDAAMSLRVESTRGCFQYVYDEDIWGALPDRKRIWPEPLRVSLGDNALMAFKQYYHSFPPRPAGSTPVPQAIWNTWGMWGQKKYLTRPVMDFAKQVGASVLVMDDPWEASQGAGEPNLTRFPHFYDDIAYARQQGINIGLWETVGWITDPFVKGLKKEDLILDRKGRPCKANWNFDPDGESYYCMDISSARVRKFLQQRTVHIMKTLKPAVIKLDFAYAMPAPSMGVPRNPEYRGERYGFELVHLIATAAKSVDPKVIIQYYGISPLWIRDVDLVSMDDQGDLWYDIPRGHQEWSLWSTLLADKNVAVCGSSGYKWDQDDEVVLNTCILGSPGAVLPIYLSDEQPVPERYFNRRLAIDRWYRRTLTWTPLWLNSRIGNFTAPPAINCWGRIEKDADGDSILTALVLRDKDTDAIRDPLIRQLQWKGRWALISQDDKAVFSSLQLALIPFDPGEISIPYPEKPAGITRLSREGESAFDQWEWSQGRLIIKVSETLLDHTAGFLISRTEEH